MEASINNILALCNGELNAIEIFEALAETKETKNIRAMCLVSKFLPADYNKTMTFAVDIPDAFLKHRKFAEGDCEIFEYLFLGAKDSHILIVDRPTDVSFTDLGLPRTIPNRHNTYETAPYFEFEGMETKAKYFEMVQENGVAKGEPICVDGFLTFTVKNLQMWNDRLIM
jgi:hypothetical protein